MKAPIDMDIAKPPTISVLYSLVQYLEHNLLTSNMSPSLWIKICGLEMIILPTQSTVNRKKKVFKVRKEKKTWDNEGLYLFFTHTEIY